MKNIYFILIALISFQSFSQTITATISYQGYDEAQAYFGEGEYQIFLDNVDGVLDKPVILIDGFDPGDVRDGQALYNMLDFNGSNLADILRDDGFDFITLNAPQYTTGGKDIDGGSDYVQRNAMVLVAMIELINSQKVGSEELVIIGPSMGGLIARYGLTYMEQNSINHETRLYLSFDSPHLGANIPVSFQYLLNYFAKEQNNTDAQLIVDNVLNSPAAKEMLIDHYSAHLLTGSDFEQDPSILLPVGAANFRNVFQAELDNLGFPQNVRNVNMINGSGVGTTIGTPGMQMISTTLDLGSGITTDIILHFTPTAGDINTVTDFTAYLASIPIASFAADAESLSYTSGLDSAPGGKASISAGLEGSANPIIIAFLDALEQEEYCFVPTLSALAITAENDWYASPNLGDSPFVNTYIPDENELHTTITNGNAAFALAEIREEPLATTTHDFSLKYELVNNPVSEQVRLRLNPSYDYLNVAITIYNYAGQQVFNDNFLNPTNELLLSHNLNSGIYMLNIIDSETTYNIKIVVE